MSAPLIIRVTVFEDSAFNVMARVYGNNAELVTAASMSTVTWAVTDMRSDAEIVAPTALVVSSVVFDSLQTGDEWDADEIGYNFLHTVPASTFTDGGVRAQIEYRATPVSGEPFDILWVRATVLNAQSH